MLAGATPANANDGFFNKNDFRVRQFTANINQGTSMITVAGTMARSMAEREFIVKVRPRFFVDQLCRSVEDPTLTMTAHGEFNAFSQAIVFAAASNTDGAQSARPSTNSALACWSVRKYPSTLCAVEAPIRPGAPKVIRYAQRR